MDQSLVSVMRNINEALRLDDDSHDKEAYLKYLDCVLCITCNLQQNVRAMGGDVVINKQVTKQVQLAQQCVERVATLVGRIGSTQKPVVLTSPQEEGSLSGQLMGAAPRPKLFVVVPPLPAEPTVNTFARAKVTTPMEVAFKQNQQLMVAYKARLKRMNKRDPGAFNLSLTIQRKMAENLAIAKRTEMALAKKMQERQDRLEEQAAKRFATPIGMSEEEQEQRHIYKKILEYEQDAKWLQDWRARLSASSQEPELICQLIQEILRCRDHPLTLLLKQYQYKVYEKLYPIVANKRQRLEVVNVPLDRALWPPDLCPSPGKERTLTGGVEENEGGGEEEGAGQEEEDEGIQTDQDPSSRSSSTEDALPENHPSMPCSGVSADPGLPPGEPQESGGPRCVPGVDSDTGCGHSLSDSRMTPRDNSGEDSTHTVCQKEGSLSENSGEAGLKTDVSDSQAVSQLHPDSMTGEVKDRDSDPDDIETTADSHDSPNVSTDKGEDLFKVPPAETGEEKAAHSQHWEASSMADVAEDSREALYRAMSKGGQLQSQLMTQQERAATILRQVSQDYESYNAENMDDLFDEDEDEKEEEERSTDVSLPEHLSTDTQSRGHPAEFKTSTSVTSRASSGDWDGVDSETGSVSSTQDFPSLPVVREEEVERLSKEAYQRHLKNISADVHMYMEKLLILFTIAYQQLDSPQGRDQCYASLEETFFKPLWKFLLMLFRLAHYQEELALACKMTQGGAGGPREMGVTNKLCLTPAAPSGGGGEGRKVKDVDPAGSPAGGDGSEVRPYSKAISHLACLQHHYTMLSKLECVVKVVHLIFDSIKEFYVSQGCAPSDVPSVGADDLLPVMTYVVMQSRLPQLVSECQAMVEFIHEGYMMGQEGYCLTTLETAVSFIVSSDLQEPISPS